MDRTGGSSRYLFMKIQCPCGAKYALDVSPDTVKSSFQLVCQVCHTDLTQAVRPLLLQALETESVPPSSPAKVPLARDPAPPTPPVSGGSLRVRSATADQAVSSEAGSTAESLQNPAIPECTRHPGEGAAEHCRVCQKPICPKCMQMFGYVCSPYCLTQAENRNLELPRYQGQQKFASARTARWFQVGVMAVALVIAGLLGLYGYFVFYASKPHLDFAVALPESTSAGSVNLLGGQSVVLVREGHLALYPLKGSSGAPVWTSELISSNEVLPAAQAEVKADRAEFFRSRDEDRKQGPQYDRAGRRIEIPEMPEHSEAEATAIAVKRLISDLSRESTVWVQGMDMWVSLPTKLVKIDGKQGQVMSEAHWEGFATHGAFEPSEFKALTRLPTGERQFVRVDLASGAVSHRALGIARPAKTGASSGRATPKSADGKAPKKGTDLPSIPPGLSAPESAIRAIELMANTRLENAMKDEDDLAPRRNHPELQDVSRVDWFASGSAALRFTAQLVDFKPVARKAMKDPPKKSALDGGVSVTQTREIANEIVNDMRRNATGGMEVEDHSSYRVRLQSFKDGGAAEWSGEVVGPPSCFSLPTVSIVVARDQILAFDSQCKKLWQAQLNYAFPESLPAIPGIELKDPEFTASPVTERGDTVYVFDPGSLYAFDKATGQSKWRLVSVGISGLYFHPDGSLYVNSTTRSTEQLRYSLQVDMNRRESSVVLKVDPTLGTVLWRSENVGHVFAVRGKTLYAVDIRSDEGGRNRPASAEISITGLNPKSGKPRWQWDQLGEWEDLAFSADRFVLLNSKEMRVMKFTQF